MLKLYHVAGYRTDIPDQSDVSHFILAYTACHAVQLFYRHYALQNLLNSVRHSFVDELDVIHPKKINDHEKDI